jgi:hypothetical protein
MENFNVIELHRTRDFSKKMNATFEFIKQNFKSLWKSILYIAGPCVLVASLLIGSFYSQFSSLFNPLTAGNPSAFDSYVFSVTFWLQVLLMLVFFLLATIMSIATINSYIVLYAEKRTNQISVQEVWDRVKKNIWMYIGTFILFYILIIVAVFILMIPGALLAQGGVLGGLLLFFYGVAAFCGFFYVIFGCMMTFFIRDYEKKGFFEAIARSLKLVSGKWWSTFGLIFILQMIVGIVSYIFIIPFYIITFISALHQIEGGNPVDTTSGTLGIIMIVCFTLYYMAQLLLGSLPNVGIAFQYFNLVERKESKGLMNAIENLGQQEQPGTGFMEGPSSENEQY